MNSPLSPAQVPPVPAPLALLLIATGAVVYAALVAGMIAAIVARFVAIGIVYLW